MAARDARTRSLNVGLSLDLMTRRFSARLPAKSLDLELLCLRFLQATRRHTDANCSVEYPETAP